MPSDPNPIMPVPAGSPAAATATVVYCPRCHSPQFFGEKRVTPLGWTLFLIGTAGSLLSIALMLIYVGFCTIWFAVPLIIVGPLLRKYVNVCAKCRQVF